MQVLGNVGLARVLSRRSIQRMVGLAGSRQVVPMPWIPEANAGGAYTLPLLSSQTKRGSMRKIVSVFVLHKNAGQIKRTMTHIRLFIAHHYSTPKPVAVSSIHLM
jgi:hypothetical protein